MPTGGGVVSSQASIFQRMEVSMATLAQPTTQAPVALRESVEAQLYVPEHTHTIREGWDGSKDLQRSAMSEMTANSN